ncbi:hypothetical protein GF340_02875 [Candidatus Peregrinibacteria bacterium]|nr:hypothetical protein [Candidatus Peregrinibacteria bacterium]
MPKRREHAEISDENLLLKKELGHKLIQLESAFSCQSKYLDNDETVKAIGRMNNTDLLKCSHYEIFTTALKELIARLHEDSITIDDFPIFKGVFLSDTEIKKRAKKIVEKLIISKFKQLLSLRGFDMGITDHPEASMPAAFQSVNEIRHIASVLIKADLIKAEVLTSSIKLKIDLDDEPVDNQGVGFRDTSPTIIMGPEQQEELLEQSSGEIDLQNLKEGGSEKHKNRVDRETDSTEVRDADLLSNDTLPPPYGTGATHLPEDLYAPAKTLDMSAYIPSEPPPASDVSGERLKGSKAETTGLMSKPASEQSVADVMAQIEQLGSDTDIKEKQVEREKKIHVPGIYILDKDFEIIERIPLYTDLLGDRDFGIGSDVLNNIVSPGQAKAIKDFHGFIRKENGTFSLHALRGSFTPMTDNPQTVSPASHNMMTKMETDVFYQIGQEEIYFSIDPSAEFTENEITNYLDRKVPVLMEEYMRTASAPIPKQDRDRARSNYAKLLSFDQQTLKSWPSHRLEFASKRIDDKLQAEYEERKKKIFQDRSAQMDLQIKALEDSKVRQDLIEKIKAERGYDTFTVEFNEEPLTAPIGFLGPALIIENANHKSVTPHLHPILTGRTDFGADKNNTLPLSVYDAAKVRQHLPKQIAQIYFDSRTGELTLYDPNGNVAVKNDKGQKLLKMRIYKLRTGYEVERDNYTLRVAGFNCAYSVNAITKVAERRCEHLLRVFEKEALTLEKYERILSELDQMLNQNMLEPKKFLEIKSKIRKAISEKWTTSLSKINNLSDDFVVNNVTGIISAMYKREEAVKKGFADQMRNLPPIEGLHLSANFSAIRAIMNLSDRPNKLEINYQLYEDEIKAHAYKLAHIYMRIASQTGSNEQAKTYSIWPLSIVRNKKKGPTLPTAREAEADAKSRMEAGLHRVGALEIAIMVEQGYLNPAMLSADDNKMYVSRVETILKVRETFARLADHNCYNKMELINGLLGTVTDNSRIDAFLNENELKEYAKMYDIDLNPSDQFILFMKRLILQTAREEFYKLGEHAESEELIKAIEWIESANQDPRQLFTASELVQIDDPAKAYDEYYGTILSAKEQARKMWNLEAVKEQSRLAQIEEDKQASQAALNHEQALRIIRAQTIRQSEELADHIVALKDDHSLKALSIFLNSDYLDLIENEQFAARMDRLGLSGWRELKNEWIARAIEVAKVCAEKAVSGYEAQFFKEVIMDCYFARQGQKFIDGYEDLGITEEALEKAMLIQKYRVRVNEILNTERTDDLSYIVEFDYSEMEQTEAEIVRQARLDIGEMKLRAVFDEYDAGQDPYQLMVAKLILQKEPELKDKLSSKQLDLLQSGKR